MNIGIFLVFPMPYLFGFSLLLKSRFMVFETNKLKFQVASALAPKTFEPFPYNLVPQKIDNYNDHIQEHNHG
jgi:hypothetical protein